MNHIINIVEISNKDNKEANKVRKKLHESKDRLLFGQDGPYMATTYMMTGRRGETRRVNGESENGGRDRVVKNETNKQTKIQLSDLNLNTAALVYKSSKI